MKKITIEIRCDDTYKEQILKGIKAFMEIFTKNNIFIITTYKVSEIEKRKNTMRKEELL